MFRNLLTAGALMLALTLGTTATATAAGPHKGHNHGQLNHNGHNHGGHNHGGYNQGGHNQGGHNHGGGISINWGSYPTFHNTSHYHYHPGSFQQHGNHFHYVPGHYDLHQTGHYHW